MAKEPVGIEFRPESTTKETIDEAVKRPRDRAARDLGLPFGLGTKAGWLDILSYISAFFGWIFLTLQFGLLFRGISFMGSGVKVERLPLIGATALAAMVVLVAQVAIRKIFAEVGVRVAQQKHSLFLFILAGVVLVGAAIAWSCMDATVVKDLASARARLNPSMALSWGHALLIGSLIGGLSTISIAAAGFTTGYRREALALVEAARADDLALAQVHINYIASVESLAAWHDSIEGLRDVELELQRLQRQLKTELDQKAAEIAKAEMERNSAERNVPKRIEQDFTPEERTRLAELRAEIANTQDKIDGLQEQLEGEGMTAPADPPKPPKTPPMAAAVENDDDDDNPKQGLRMVI